MNTILSFIGFNLLTIHLTAAPLMEVQRRMMVHAPHAAQSGVLEVAHAGAQ